LGANVKKAKVVIFISPSVIAPLDFASAQPCAIGLGSE
jgi:hypothetical protein